MPTTRAGRLREPATWRPSAAVTSTGSRRSPPRRATTSSAAARDPAASAPARTTTGNDDGRAVLRAAPVDAREAAEAALKAHPGVRVTPVDFDDDHATAAHWEVEFRDGDRER
ncbi:hypothetical protein [Streptomyces xantholiticus]|uniref:hypothetical protein n=1 Tax=Streptomyces xantholiticus TaxID=68285 RepID=UPI001679FF4D|nr:hypothetical protein [Streptomyces xantholiticus]